MNVHAVPSDDRGADLAYLSARAFGPQWRAFLDALAGELFENFAADEARGFFRQIGTRMARDVPLRPSTTLEDLEHSINAALGGLDWGYARLFLDDAAMIIVHRAYPGSHRADGPSAWTHAFAAVLEGLYTAWVQSQGGRPEMRAHVQEDAPGDALVFKFGY